MSTHNTCEDARYWCPITLAEMLPNADAKNELLQITACSIANNHSVPTQNDIAVPESVLKKQKAHQKTTDSQAADLKKKREV